jgi:cell division protein ZapA
MRQHEAEVAGATAVTIYGRTYHLRGNEDPAYLTHLAGLVDARMREVADATGTADTLKVAILAALNIADDSLQAAGAAAPAAVDRSADSRVARMINLLDEALAG